MRYASISCFIAMVSLSVHAQTGAINVRGKVTSGGAAVAGATVTLLGKAKTTTTDAQGAYTITDATPSPLIPSDRSMNGNFHFKNGVLELGVTQSASVKVEVFDVMGNLLKKEAPKNIDAGIYRMSIAELSQAPQILFVKASIGEESRTWRYDSFQNGIYLVNSRAGKDQTTTGAGLAKVAAVVDSIKVEKQGFTTTVKTIESLDVMVDVVLTASTGGGGKWVEDEGHDCVVTPPTTSNGGSATVLPDPFTKWDGTQVKTMADWRCRRRELVLEVERRILGTKAPPPHLKGGTVTGTISNTAYTVNVETPDGKITFSGTVTLPSTGTAPYPAVIVVGGFNSLNPEVLSSEGVATISYNNNDIMPETAGNTSTGKYFTVNAAQKGSTSATVAWAWGVSRMIDMMEKNPGVIDPKKLGIHGCSRLGKAAFVIGAFDQRIALGLPLEPGTGGPAPLRSLPTLGGQTLASANSEASWFGPMSKTYSATVAAADMDDVASMYAPRGLLMMDNAHIAHLAYKANYLGVAAAREVFTAMGKADAAWYLGSSANGNHCAVRPEYGAPLRAMIKKYFKGDATATTGGLDKNATHGTINVEAWTAGWKKGAIAP